MSEPPFSPLACEALEAALVALRANHVPDSRLAVWDVDVREEDGRLVVSGWTTTAAIGEIRRLATASGAEARVGLLPDPALSPEMLGVAHRSLAHLRREPRHSAELVDQLVLGEEATVLREQGEWLQVQTGYGYVGWIHGGSLVRRAPTENPAALRERLEARRPPAGTWIVTERSPLARRDPAPDAPAACDLVRGARVGVAAEEEGWLRIAMPDRVEGWIPAGAAVPHERLGERFPRTGAAILEHAAEYLGVPYLWGGTSEKGFDCSGFVQRIYGLHGIALPRDSDQQSAVGDKVEPGEGWEGVADGDLAFFAETPGGRATHVGILARGARLLHASTTRNGVAWDALPPAASGWSDFGARLAASLTAIRRVAE